MADVVCQVVRKFNNYNIGEKLSANADQVASWVKQGVVVVVPTGTPEAKVQAAPPINKMVSVADEAKADDEPPQRRGPGRPSRDRE